MRITHNDIHFVVNMLKFWLLKRSHVDDPRSIGQIDNIYVSETLFYDNHDKLECC